MNQKNSLGLNNCFLDLDDPIELFKVWMDEAKKSEPNDPNALSLATSNNCLLYTSPSPRDQRGSRMPSSA